MHWALVVVTVGGVLQIAGVFLVFIQIGSAEKLLGARTWANQLGGWLKARLPARRKLRDYSLSAVGAAVSSGSAELTLQRSRGSTVEERLTSLQLQMDDARRELDELRTRSTAHRAESDRKLAEVSSSVRALEAELRGLIAALTIGSRHLQVVGAMLIMFGTALIVAGPLGALWFGWSW